MQSSTHNAKQLPLWADNDRPQKRKTKHTKNPHNSAWIKAYVEALFHNRHVSLTQDKPLTRGYK